MGREIIEGFVKQFEYEPKIENWPHIHKFRKFAVIGMGGSSLAAEIIKLWDPLCDLYIHKDYGLPPIPKKYRKNTLFILSSYSGNTEEVTDSLDIILKEQLTAVVISSGGKLLNMAKEKNIPYITLPEFSFGTRFALGFSLLALSRIMGLDRLFNQLKKHGSLLKPNLMEERGRDLASKFKGFMPIIYSSLKNKALGYNWKIRFNENSKIPAFSNVLPEIHHNEIAALDLGEFELGFVKERFCFLLFNDINDHPRIIQRMNLLTQEFALKNINFEILTLGNNKSFIAEILNFLILADWVTYYLSESYGVSFDEIKVIDDFKKKLND